LIFLISISQEEMSKVEENYDTTMNRFEKEFFFLSGDVQRVMVNLLTAMFAWGTPRRWVKFARTQWRGSRSQLDSALPVLQILSPSVKIEEEAADTFYVIWNTDEFVVQPDLKKLNEIISIRMDCEPAISRLLQLL
jgi:hypothetical protein